MNLFAANNPLCLRFSLQIQFLGAANTVTGSRTLIQFNGSSYLVDCGLFQGPRDIRIRNWTPISDAHKIKAILLTHAHIDHSGYIPKIINEGFRGPIYCSPATADLAKIMLPDSGYLQEEDARFLNTKRLSRHTPALPLYTEEDAVHALDFFAPRPCNEWIELERGVSFRLTRSGHILGSNFIEISYETSNGSKILTFSGDLGNGRSLLLKEPVQITETDDLILESTYGNRSQKHGNELNELAEIINKVILRGGTLIIPAFSVGRTQDILLMISRLEKNRKIPITRVFLDSPMALDATDVYLKYKDDLKPDLVENKAFAPLASSQFTAVRTADESMILCMDDEPKIVISAAGMLTGGRVLHHLRMKLPKAKNGVLFVGYQVEGTKGSLLRSGLSKINIHHQEVDVEAEIFNIDGLSAHADSDYLVHWVKGFSRKPRRIFLNHGEKSALEALKYRLEHELGIPSIIAAPDEKYLL